MRYLIPILIALSFVGCTKHEDASSSEAPKKYGFVEGVGQYMSWVDNGVTVSTPENLGLTVGHELLTGTAPTLTTCGSTPSPSISGSDIAGKYTTGGTATTCTITFAKTYTNAPACLIHTEGNATQPTYTVSATAMTVTVDVAQTVYDYECFSIGAGGT
jgi:hypothetical protein